MVATSQSLSVNSTSKNSQEHSVDTLSSARREFETEAAPHYSSLMKRALQLTRNRQDAEDLVQEAMFRAYRSWSKYERGSNCAAWLQKIMYNSFLNSRRSLSSAGEPVDFDDVSDSVSLISQNKGYVPGRPDHELRKDTIDRLIEKSLDALPRGYAQPVLLFLWGGLRYESIAKILAVRVGTVKSRIYRARTILKSDLRELYLALNGTDGIDVTVYGGHQNHRVTKARLAA